MSRLMEHLNWTERPMITVSLESGEVMCGGCVMCEGVRVCVWEGGICCITVRVQYVAPVLHNGSQCGIFVNGLLIQTSLAN